MSKSQPVSPPSKGKDTSKLNAKSVAKKNKSTPKKGSETKSSVVKSAVEGVNSSNKETKSGGERENLVQRQDSKLAKIVTN